jgi:hypothetical protein
MWIGERNDFYRSIDFSLREGSSREAIEGDCLNREAGERQAAQTVLTTHFLA